MTQSKALLFALVALLPLPALAGEASPPAAVPSISQMLPEEAAAPKPATAPAASSAPYNFPALPPSRLCSPRDVRYVWQLKQLYEHPTGEETAAFTQLPSQYIGFNKNGLFRTYRTSNRQLGAQAVHRQLARQKPARLQQYLVHESGIIFFYIDSVHSESVACFIVTSALGQFKPGQMLLMPPAPPEGQPITKRIVKVYEKVVKPKPGKRKPRRKGRR